MVMIMGTTITSLQGTIMITIMNITRTIMIITTITIMTTIIMIMGIIGTVTIGSMA
jgi:hypothetical protein